MYWRRLVVLLGSLLLGFGAGGFVSDGANASYYGFAAGLGLGSILTAFVRD